MKKNIAITLRWLVFSLLAAVFLLITACGNDGGKTDSGDIPTLVEAASIPNVDATGLFSINRSMSSIKSGVKLPDFSTGVESAIALDTGFALFTRSKNSSAYYNNIIDLNTLFEEGRNLISFEVFADASYKTSEIEIRLVDAYDAGKSVSVFFTENMENVRQTLITAKSTNGLRAFGRDNIEGGISLLGASTYSNNFSGYLHPNYKHCPFTVKFDPYENKVYTQLEYGKDSVLLDLDSPEDVGSEYLFSGFTTGEVYIQIIFSDIKGAGAIAVTEVGGEKVDAVPLINKNILLDMDYEFYREETLYSGAVGYKYQLPVPLSEDSLHGKLDIKTELYKDSTPVPFSNYGFVPDAANEYTVIYTAMDIYGNEISKEYDFTIVASPIPIIVEFETADYTVLDSIVLPKATATGGHGDLSVSVTFDYSGSLIPDKYGRTKLTEAGELVMNVTATDRSGQVKESSKVYTVAGGSHITFKDPIPKSLRGGATIELPRFSASFFSESGNSALDTSVWVGNTKITNPLAYFVPNSTTPVVVDFYGDKGGANEVKKSVTFDVFTGASGNLGNRVTSNVANFFKVSSGATVDMTPTPSQPKPGAEVSISGSVSYASIEYPYALAATNLSLFTRIPGTSNYGYVEVELTDAYDLTRTIKFRIIPRPQISQIVCQDADGGFTLRYSTAAYNTTANNGDYSLIYDNSNGTIQTQGYLEIADIKYFADGTPFYGFIGDAVFVKFTVGENTANSTFTIRQLSNQPFAVASSVAASAQRRGPAISMSAGLGTSTTLKQGETFNIPKVNAYSVLSGEVRPVKIFVTPPAGGGDMYVVENGLDGHSLVLDTIGNYGVSFQAAADTGGSITNSSTYYLHIFDEKAPEIAINGTIKTQYKLNESITLPGYTVADNVTAANDMNVQVLIYRPDLKINVVASGDKYTFTISGKYEIVYYTTDEAGNAGRTSVIVEVLA